MNFNTVEGLTEKQLEELYDDIVFNPQNDKYCWACSHGYNVKNGGFCVHYHGQDVDCTQSPWRTGTQIHNCRISYCTYHYFNCDDYNIY